MKRPKVSIYTQVYNAEPYLKQCISSVLNQTFENFEYIIIDNGCTDRSPEIIRHFMERDLRIKLVTYEVNKLCDRWSSLAKSEGGEYIAELDSDDWLEPTFLERMVQLLECEQADIACTGTEMHIEGTNRSNMRSFPKRMCLNKDEFSRYFPYYHQFFRTIWAKVVRRDVYLRANLEAVDQAGTLYGTDTLFSFELLRNSKRICIDNSILQHYRIRQGSVSSKYDSAHFYSDVYLYNDAVDFLCQFGPVSEENRHFLALVYGNAVLDTGRVLYNSSLSLEEKLKEYRTIAEHSVTQASFRQNGKDLETQHKELLTQVLNIGAKLPAGENEDFAATVQALLPQCGAVLTLESLHLFLAEPDLMSALLRDQRDELMERLLDLIQAKRHTKRYDLGKLVQRLAVGQIMLCEIDDTSFLRKYRDIYSTVWCGEIATALEEMTGLLLENQVDGAKETFLSLYLSLAAAQEEIPAFIFGNIRLAELYLRQRKKAECQAVLNDLAEMGVEDDEEISALRRELERLQ